MILLSIMMILLSIKYNLDRIATERILFLLRSVRFQKMINKLFTKKKKFSFRFTKFAMCLCMSCED